MNERLGEEVCQGIGISVDTFNQGPWRVGLMKGHVKVKTMPETRSRRNQLVAVQATFSLR